MTKKLKLRFGALLFPTSTLALLSSGGGDLNALINPGPASWACLIATNSILPGSGSYSLKTSF
jgi:hypothetical protein